MNEIRSLLRGLGFKLENGCERVFGYTLALFAGTVGLSMILFMLTSMVGRNLKITGLATWCVEMGHILVLWVFILPMAYAMFSGGMIRVTFFVSKMPEKLRPWFEVLSSLSCIAIAAALFYAGTRFLLAVLPGAYYPETHFPAAIVRAAIPIGGAGLLIAGLIVLRRNVSGAMRGRLSRSL